MDRRAVFFLIAAALSVVLIPVVPDDPAHPTLTQIGPILTVALVVMALLSWLDHRGRLRGRGR